MDYLKFGYLYFKELLLNVELPLQKKEIKYLYRKMQKRQSINLVKFFWEKKDIKTTRRVMKEIDFSLADFIFSFFK